mmetsp:Transcript_13292/g.22444  ORF Transcript_13292/g.22444 Transcript_13292/m.22444 type:complete len:336 (+) Transcript_13292:139-1146(+)|eukprot:CAMPEP_0198204218 /NCGR_PEP_ID=MMETSP1445-20131203/7604_1 /TAXON_ID=36898 /ORGANISM="Pyramimonas sp., Strain CCMP2087" /LENGTH=335 /DNA_ID=CAMNT_0043875991 /DNA_START=121 /DNA_END=1128 /DNA_ORIENTATION=-
MEVVDAIRSSGRHPLKQKFEKALLCAEQALALYSAKGIAFSFNGGKDSTVVLHILRAAVAKRAAEAGSEEAGSAGPLEAITTFFFENNNEFPEVTSFTAEEARTYKLNCRVLKNDKPFIEGVQELIDDLNLKAFVMGTRRGDPNGAEQDAFCPSSPGWPLFMRVNPIIDWTYNEVWEFLRVTKSRYCSLYAEGYTSLGGVHNTAKNEALRRTDGTYAPAHELSDGNQERNGRSRKVPMSTEGKVSTTSTEPGTEITEQGTEITARGTESTAQGTEITEQKALSSHREDTTVGILVVGSDNLAGQVESTNQAAVTISCDKLVSKLPAGVAARVTHT